MPRLMYFTHDALNTIQGRAGTVEGGRTGEGGGEGAVEHKQRKEAKEAKRASEQMQSLQGSRKVGERTGAMPACAEWSRQVQLRSDHIQRDAKATVLRGM